MGHRIKEPSMQENGLINFWKVISEVSSFVGNPVFPFSDINYINNLNSQFKPMDLCFYNQL